MNKKGKIEPDDVTEFIKIGILVVVGTILIRALLSAW